MTRAAARNAAVLLTGLAVLGVVLFNATNVDSQPPRVAGYALTHHLGSADDVALTNSSIEVTFSEAVDKASAEGAFEVVPAMDGTFSWAGTTMSFSPSGGLPIDAEFSVTIAAGVRDAAGNVSGGAADAFTFRTVGRPAVAASDPLPGGEVAGRSPLILTFSTLMDTASVDRALHITPAFAHELRWSGETLAVVPMEPLAPGTAYRLTVDRRATDLAGNRMLDPFVLEFSGVGDLLSPAWLVPADGVAGVSPWSVIAVGFDRAIDADGVDAAFSVEPDVAGSLALIEDPAGDASAPRPPRPSVLRFQPSSPLPANTTFTVTVASDIRAVDGAVPSQPLTWSFTTGAPFPSLENQVLFLSERAGVRNVWAMNPDGSNQRQLSAELSAIVSYDVSPDGRRFVTGDGQRLIEYAADGGQRRVLTDDGVVEFDPSYRADGGELVFSRADAATGGGLGLWTRDPGGGAPRRVEIASPSQPPVASRSLDATPAGSEAPPAAEPILRTPRYSPDGAWLAFVRPGAAIGLIELENGSVTEVPFAAIGAPAWLEDSSAAVFAGAPPPRGGEEPTDSLHAIASPEGPPAGVSLSSLRLVRLAPGEERLRATGLRDGTFAPVVGSSGELMFLRANEDLERLAGSIWVAASATDQADRIGPGDFRATSAALGPDPGALAVAARVRVGSDGAVRPDGLWAVSPDGRLPFRLTEDGDSPRWLP